MELNRYDRAVPTRMMDATEPLRRGRSRMIIATGMRAMMNAPAPSPAGRRVNPTIMVTATPSDAPEDTPVVYGSYRGFFIRLCMAAP